MGISSLSRRAIFLDRDGVLNRARWRNGKLVPPASLDELDLLPGVGEACTALRAAGFLLIVVTNQPDVARGTQDRKTVEAINAAIRQKVPLDDVRVCYHDDANRCACRKPKPGLLLQAASDWDIDVGRSFLVGDRWKDIEAARQAGCHAVMVENRHPQEKDSACTPDLRVPSLRQAADWILKLSNNGPLRSAFEFTKGTPYETSE
jgi:D-glycero-D-manno-heptose 1,7-bisphosphate phosphatase